MFLFDPYCLLGLLWLLCGTGTTQLRERQWIEARKNELIQGARPHEAEIPDAPSKPEDPMEIERHEVTHIPPMPWCLRVSFGQGSRCVSFS